MKGSNYRALTGKIFVLDRRSFFIINVNLLQLNLHQAGTLGVPGRPLKKGFVIS